MLFEGSEKKVEVATRGGVGSLRDLPREFWDQIVAKSEAQVLSVISTKECAAYLLSESSLFVWDDHFTMITCGQTQLVNAVFEFAEKVGIDNIDSLIFERKNEYFPRHQKSDFFEDYERLKSAFGGQAFRFGNADDHHLFLYHLDKSFEPPVEDYTVEILMYDLQGRAKEVFSKEGQTVDSIREATGVHEILPGFTIDDYVFKPRGYSLNALSGANYYTIHVTPEESGSYVSFESNIQQTNQFRPLIEKVVQTFEPNSYDVVLFSPKPLGFHHRLPGFHMKSDVEQDLSNGYSVKFLSFFKEVDQIQPASLIVKEPLDGA
ncbi:MAG: adenosylmethionine decarboxylase [Pseudomonadota bacterium]